MRNYNEINYRGAVVYAIVNIINRKKYVGSTFGFNKRKREHRSALRKNIVDDHHKSVKMQNAWNKYGENNFDIIILQYCGKNKRELLRCEQMWMNFYDVIKNGYNILPKASSCKGVKRTKETIEKLRNGRLGKKASAETKKLLSDSHIGIQLGANHGYSKPVAQYDLEGNLIAEYDCARDISRATGLDYKNISACCLGIRKYHKGFIFVFSEKNKNKQQKKVDAIITGMAKHINPNCKKIAQYDFDGRLIKIWDSIVETEKHGFSCGTIQQSCSGKCAQHKRYIWLYMEDVNRMSKKELKNILLQRTFNNRIVSPIVQSNIDGSVVKIWDSLSDIGDCGFSKSCVCNCCKGKKESHRGFRWQYADQLTAPVAV